MASLQVTAPARLHLGFVNLSFESNSQYGSLGLAIDRPAVCLNATTSNDSVVNGLTEPAKALRYIGKLQELTNSDAGIHIDIAKTIPSHVGLGSGTQLALAIAVAYTQLYGTCQSISELSTLVGRGKRSAIGTAAFETGGFIVDRNPSAAQPHRTIVHRTEFPSDWRILLVLDKKLKGAHGNLEIEAFDRLKRFSESLSNKLTELLTQQALPALVDHDIKQFGLAITKIQNEVGDSFAFAQGGRYLSKDVAEVLEFALNNGAAGIGQSSWGPTGFALFENVKLATKMQHTLELRTHKSIRTMICKARNVGASIVEVEGTVTQLDSANVPIKETATG